MFFGHKFPYTTLHELNLDWLIGIVKKAVMSVNGYTPDENGNVQLPTVPTVSSVNGQQGDVVLDAADVGAVPDTVTVPTKTSQLENDSGFITAAQAGAVTSVNGQIGDVNITAQGIGALTSILAAYPIGSIYMSILSTDPASLFGGGWQRIEDLFLLAAGNRFAPGIIGGEATHTLTKAELPNENLELHATVQGTDFKFGWAGVTVQSGTGSVVGSCAANPTDNLYYTHLGNGTPMNNMPPYLSVYVWKRVA